MASAQLAAREYFRDQSIVRSAARRCAIPGPFARFSRSPIVYRRPAPRLDEHGAGDPRASSRARPAGPLDPRTSPARAPVRSEASRSST